MAEKLTPEEFDRQFKKAQADPELVAAAKVDWNVANKAAVAAFASFQSNEDGSVPDVGNILARLAICAEVLQGLMRGLCPDLTELPAETTCQLDQIQDKVAGEVQGMLSGIIREKIEAMDKSVQGMVKDAIRQKFGGKRPE